MDDSSNKPKDENGQKKHSLLWSILKFILMMTIVLLAPSIDNFLVGIGLPLTAGLIMFIMGVLAGYLLAKI